MDLFNRGYFPGPYPGQQAPAAAQPNLLTAGDNLTPGVDSSQATALALLNALGGPMDRVGYERSAGPIGSIAKNLIPLFGAMVQGQAYSQAAAAQAKQQQFENMISLMKAGGGTGNPEMDAAKLEQTKAKTDLIKAQTTAAGNPKNKTDNELYADMINNNDPTAAAILRAKQENRIATAQALGEAQNPGRFSLFKQEQDFKAAQLKPPPPKLVEGMSQQVGALHTLDDALKGFEGTTGLDILQSKLTGGIMSNQAMRDYAKIFNDKDNLRAGARGMTNAALERIYNEMPNPLMALAKPAEFMAQLRKVRSDMYSDFALKTNTYSKSFKLGDDLTGAIDALAPQNSPGMVPRNPPVTSPVTTPTPSAATMQNAPPEIDFNDPQLQSDFEAIKKAYPKMTPDEMVYYHMHYGRPK